MMSTMVLNRKASIFGGAGARGGSLGAGLVLEGQRCGKDSIDKMDLTVMDTKLKILEILQVTLEFNNSDVHIIPVFSISICMFHIY